MASIASLAGSLDSRVSLQFEQEPGLRSAVGGSEDVIFIGKPLERPESPLYPEYESRHSSSSSEIHATGGRLKERWSSKLDFIMSSLAMSIGLGNVWRFPFAVYENGGGAFLIPYFILLFAIAKPISVVDLSIGQFSGKGPFAVWDVVPILRGLGVTTIIIAGTTLTYVSTILAFCVAYLFRGFENKLPWIECNTDLYVKRKFIENLTCSSASPGEFYSTSDENSTEYYKSNAELYFQYAIVKQVEEIDEGIGTPDGQLAICLLVVWILIFSSFICGPKSTGKVAYFTAIFPFIVLLVFMGRALSLKGASAGIKYFFTPDWRAILTFRVWRNALSQAFFSLAVGYGTMSYGSFNPFRQGIKSEAILVGVTDGATCVIAGVTAFAILGELSHRQGLGIDEIAQSDLGLAFVTYPEVLAYFGPTPWPQIFSIIFFGMLLSLGIGHSAGYFHPIMSTVYYVFPWTARTRGRKVCTTGFVCCLGFLSGLVYTAPGGLFLIHLMDHFITGIVVYSAILMELVGLFWVYGVRNYVHDMEFMLETKFSRVYKWWCYFIPIFMVIVTFYTLLDFEEPVVHLNHRPVELPLEILRLGYLLAFVALGAIPVGAVIVCCTRKTGSCGKKYMASINPNKRWVPADPNVRAEWETFKKSFLNRRKGCDEPHGYKVFIGKLNRRKNNKWLTDTSIGTESVEGRDGTEMQTWAHGEVPGQQILNIHISTVNQTNGPQQTGLVSSQSRLEEPSV